MRSGAAEFIEREFLEVATRNAREIGRSEDPRDILLRYALDYTKAPAETVSWVVWLLRGQNREYPQEVIDNFLRTNAKTHAVSLAKKVAPTRSIPETQSVEPVRESKGQSKSSFPPGWSMGRIINYLRSRDRFRENEGCQELLRDPAFARSVRMVPTQRVSAHLLAGLLNISPAQVADIEKGAIPVSPEICESLIEIFGFHERAAEEFRSRAGTEKVARTSGDSTRTTGASEPENTTLFTTPLFAQMRDNLRQLLTTGGPVYMGDGVSELWSTQRELLEQFALFLETPVGGKIPGLEGGHTKRGQFMEALSATGTGKTDSFGRLATAMNKGIRVPVLILTPRQFLNAQTKKRFCRMHSVDEKDILIWDSNQPLRERTRLFQQNPSPTYIIASYQSLFKLINDLQLDFTTPGSKYYRPLVILDEVPEAIGLVTGKLIRETFIDKVLVAAFAAADAGAAAVLFRGQAPLYNLGIVEGIERDVLCKKLETRIIEVPLEDDTESAALLERMRAVHGDEAYNQSDTNMFAENPGVISPAVDFHLTYYHEDAGYVRDLPTVFFIDGINAAKQGARIFNERARELGLSARAAYVSSRGSLFVDHDEDGNVTRMTNNSDEILRMLDAGDVQAVWNDQLVGIGVDLPNLSVCYHVGHTHSLYRLLQEMGRTTRRGDGNKTALAFNVCASGTDPYLYEDVLGSNAVESRQRREREKKGRVSNSRSRGTMPQDPQVSYLPVPNIRIYATRAEWQADSSLRRGTYQLQLKATRVTKEDIFKTTTIAEFVKLLSGYTGLSLRQLDITLGRERYLQSLAKGTNKGSLSRGVLLPFLRQHYSELAEHFDHISRISGEDILKTSTVADFVRLLPDHTGLSLRQLDIRLGKEKYLDKLARGENEGSLSREIILPFLRQHYSELVEHFDHISGVSLPVVRLLKTENSADFLGILCEVHPLPIRGHFYRAVETNTDTYSLWTQGKHIPSESAIAGFRPYLRQQTGSDALYQHLLAIRNEEAETRAAVSISPDVLMAARDIGEFLTLLLDAHPPKIGGGRRRFYSSVGMSRSSYSEAALGVSVPAESVIARFQPYLRQITGSDEAYQHLMRLRDEPVKTKTRRRSNSSDISKGSRVAPAKQFLDAWDINKEQIADDKRAGVLMRKLREANGMSLEELADYFRSRGINCDHSKIVYWEKGDSFPRDAEAVVEEYTALALALAKQATEGGSLAGAAEQVRECLTLEAERRKEKRRKNPGPKMGALVAVPVTAAATLLGGGAVPPSQGPPSTHVVVQSPSIEHRHLARLLPASDREGFHDFQKQGKQKDIGTHVEETGLKGLRNKLLGKIRPPVKGQGLGIG
jgi:superfamily II DNA or RNA helicase/transcriptional regulator with XRE-family HTH domain